MKEEKHKGRDSCSDPGTSCEALNFNVHVNYLGSLFKMQIPNSYF